jgi:DNA transformation protein and related proteins
MTPITSLMNLGAKTANWLAAVGIHTAEDLEQVGVVEAYCAVKKLYPERANLNLLYALQGMHFRVRCLAFRGHFCPKR